MAHDMDMFTLLLIFFGGLLGLFLLGRLLGHMFGLDKFFDDSDKIDTAMPYRTRKKRGNKGKNNPSGRVTKSNFSQISEWRRWWNPA